jgi:hypothetical protein
VKQVLPVKTTAGLLLRAAPRARLRLSRQSAQMSVRACLDMEVSKKLEVV